MTQIKSYKLNTNGETVVAMPANSKVLSVTPFQEEGKPTDHVRLLALVDHTKPVVNKAFLIAVTLATLPYEIDQLEYIDSTEIFGPVLNSTSVVFEVMW